MKNLLTIATCILALAACQNSSSSDTANSTAVDSTAITPIADPGTAQIACYLFAEGKDSTTVSLNLAADGTVTGSYDWQPHEQHGASGTLTGKKDGDLLKVMYDYTIEGSNQQQEVVFKLSGDQLSEGQGELVDGEGGILKIKDATKLTWKPFTKVACK